MDKIEEGKAQWETTMLRFGGGLLAPLLLVLHGLENVVPVRFRGVLQQQHPPQREGKHRRQGEYQNTALGHTEAKKPNARALPARLALRWSLLLVPLE